MNFRSLYGYTLNGVAIHSAPSWDSKWRMASVMLSSLNIILVSNKTLNECKKYAI